MKKLFKILVYCLLGLITLIKLAGCFKFRDSEKELNRTFSERGFSVQSKFLEKDNQKIHFVYTGTNDSSSRVVCFVHGSPGGSNNFNNNLLDSLLQLSFEMISVDRPGFGYSDFGRAVPSLKDQAEFLQPLLDSFRNKELILVGHSYGGPLIAQIAVSYPELVDGLIIVAGSIDPDLEPDEWWRKPANSKLARWILPKVMTTSNSEILSLKDDLKELKKGWSSIKIPVIVLQGEKDNLVPPGNADFAERFIDSSAYLKIHRFKNLNHFIPFKNHEVITEAIFEMDSILSLNR